MSEKITEFTKNDGSGETGTPCKVAVFYEDHESRERVLKLSSRLARKFMSEVDLDFSWWKFQFLEDGVIAGLAAQSAAQADMIFYALGATAELPSAVQACNELWLDQRQSENGLLVAIIGGDNGTLRQNTPVHGYLADLARRAQMQFISRWESQPPEGMDYLDMMLRRANESSPVLDEMLARAQQTTHWGINE